MCSLAYFRFNERRAGQAACGGEERSLDLGKIGRVPLFTAALLPITLGRRPVQETSFMSENQNDPTSRLPVAPSLSSLPGSPPLSRPGFSFIDTRVLHMTGLSI